MNSSTGTQSPAPYQIWNSIDQKRYIRQEKDDERNAKIIYQAQVDQPMDAAFLPKYILPIKDNHPILKENGPDSIKVEYEESLDRVNPSGKIYRCQLGACTRTFLTVESFFQHLTQHRAKCADCQQEFDQWAHLLHHAEICRARLQRPRVEIEETKIKPKTKSTVQCQLCGTRCNNPTALSRHQFLLHNRQPRRTTWLLKR